MKKYLAPILAMTMLLGILAGCSMSKPAESVTTAPATT